MHSDALLVSHVAIKLQKVLAKLLIVILLSVLRETADHTAKHEWFAMTANSNGRKSPSQPLQFHLLKVFYPTASVVPTSTQCMPEVNSGLDERLLDTCNMFGENSTYNATFSHPTRPKTSTRTTILQKTPQTKNTITIKYV